MKILLFLTLPLWLFASQILSYNIYERSDRADVMITFDTPFTGVIKQGKSKNKIIIKLEGASIESTKVKRVNSSFLHSLSITPLKNYTQLVASISPSTKLIASKTSDAYGLRLRFSKKANSPKNSTFQSDAPTDLSALPTKPVGEFSRSYYIVVAILIIGIIIMLYLKKKIQPINQKKAKNSWLFEHKQEQEPQTTNAPTPKEQITVNDNKSTDISIRFQKAIDNTNSVVMLDFGQESYLVMMGNSNILLDKFVDDKPNTQLEFETILQERNQELEDFLGSPRSSSKCSETQEPLQAYKERAASLIYAEES